MDPFAHTFTGAALAAAGLRRATPLATAALLIGANAADVDVVTHLAGENASLAFRRGWTHGLAAVAVLPFLVAGGLLVWDRQIRRRRRPNAAPARAGPLLGVAALAVATHPALDWLNNYGLRWLMPFDGRWFYGDALFILDPWVWLALGGVLFLHHSAQRAALAGWLALFALGSMLIFSADVPPAARGVWVGGLALLLGVRALGVSGASRPAGTERAARAALAAVAAYMGVQAAANVPARAEVRAALADAGIASIERVMVAPAPADPLAGTVVAEAGDAYYIGDWHWLAEPRFRAADTPLAKRPAENRIVAAAAATTAARRFLVWARFPYYEVESDASGHTVRILDARYHDSPGRIGSVVVRLDAQLRPLPQH